jgi:hypothetical protein
LGVYSEVYSLSLLCEEKKQIWKGATKNKLSKKELFFILVCKVEIFEPRKIGMWAAAL